MNWLIIISIILLFAVICTPIIWLLIKAVKNKEFQHTPIERVAFIKEWEMIENMYGDKKK